MGILDTNLSRVQFLEKTNPVATLATPSSISIDCRKFNMFNLSLLAVTSAQEVEVLGTYYNGSTTKYTYALRAIDVSGETIGLKQITSIPTNSWSQFIIDVTLFSSITITKISTSGELSYSSFLTSKPFNDAEYYGFEKFMQFKKTAGIFNASDVIRITRDVNQNAVILKIENTAEITAFKLFAEDVSYTRRWFNISKGEYLTNRDTLPIGTTYIAIPIENRESLAFINAGGGTIKASFKFDNFDFKIDADRLYWEKQNGAIGSANELVKPIGAKWAKVTLNGPLSNGMSVVLHAKKASIVKPNSNPLNKYHLAVNLPLYNNVSGTKIADSVIPISNEQSSYFFNAENIESVSLGSSIGSPLVDLKAIFNFYEDIDENIKNAILGVSASDGSQDSYFKNVNLKPFFEDSNMVVLMDNSTRKLRGLLKDIAVWHNSTQVAISKTGVDGEQIVLDLTAANFPNLIADSTIEHVIILHWNRINGTVPMASYRINLITTKGQVYHNNPSRAADHDGAESANDWYTFEESVVWDLETRTTPVKTKTGQDATLIATGKYHYFPALRDEAYEFHPALNQVSPYGNTGFGAVSEKVQVQNGVIGDTVKFSRFHFTDRSNGLQANPLGFMGGFETHPKLSMLATYKSNSDRPTRICVFMTNDGGRQWFCRWEAGITGERKYANESLASVAVPTFLDRKLITSQMSSPANNGLYNAVKRIQYIPDATNKEIEKTKKFDYAAPVSVFSITANVGDITVVTNSAHGFRNGELILFEKQNETPNEWDWIVNTGHTQLDAGTGIYFKVRLVNATTFTLEEVVGNPNQNLTVRHIHSLNRCKDGYSFGCGETYPEGWMFWIPVRESDYFIRKFPWDKFDFIRLNSVREAVQRPLGFTIEHDANNTVYVGIDNEYTVLPNVELPPGRTDTFKRSSNGAWRGKLVDFDDQSKFECIFPSDEVCYLFKKINGVFVYTGQQGHVGMSKTGNPGTWFECRVPLIPQRFGGINNDGWFVIDGLLFKIK